MNIILIGAGPRGLVVAERLIEHQKVSHKLNSLKITLIDPFGVGGRVWSVDQPHELIMNTTSDYITLFTDSTCKMTGPCVQGPNLFEWSQEFAYSFITRQRYSNKFHLLDEIKNLAYNDYASRSLYGAYLQWFYTYLQQRLDISMQLQMIESTVTSINLKNQNIIVNTTDSVLSADNVIMALGHHENAYSADQIKLSNFSKEHGLNYWAPTEPQEYVFKNVPPQKTIILRGLGLSFFDAVTLLTIGRNGHYERNEKGTLIYHPSGLEPKIIAGSRRGYPLHGKGINDHPANQHDTPQFLNTAWIDQKLKAKKGTLGGSELINRIHYEIEYAYYKRLIVKKYPALDVVQIMDTFRTASDPRSVIQKLPIKAHDYFDWIKLLNPSKSNLSLKEYLERDIAIGHEGTTNGPYAGALAMYHEIYNEIRRIIDAQLLTDDDYYVYILKQLNKEHSFLSVGPPVMRIEQLHALINAKIVTILAPGMVVKTNKHLNTFETWSKLDPHRRYSSDFLVDARLPKIDSSTSKNPLIRQLLDSGIGRAHQLSLNQEHFNTGAVQVNIETETLSMDLQNHSIFFWGIPTEGQRWLTTASPHPDNNDVLLVTGDKISELIFSNSVENS